MENLYELPEDHTEETKKLLEKSDKLRDKSQVLNKLMGDTQKKVDTLLHPDTPKDNESAN